MHLMRRTPLFAAASAARCKPYPCRIVVDPATKLVALNGLPGSLQFFNILRDRFEFNQTGARMHLPFHCISRGSGAAQLCAAQCGPACLADRGRARRVQRGSALVSTSLSSHCAQDGEWMVTVEHRNDYQSQAELRLKFWRNSRETRARCDWQYFGRLRSHV